MIDLLFAVDVPAIVDVGTPMMNMIGSLGGSAAAVLVLWICNNQAQRRDVQTDALISRLYEQLETIATDKGAVIRDITVAMSEVKLAVRENTLGTQRLETAVHELAGSIHGISSDRVKRT